MIEYLIIIVWIIKELHPMPDIKENSSDKQEEPIKTQWGWLIGSCIGGLVATYLLVVVTKFLMRLAGFA